MKARKRFGQHFLQPAWVRKVVEAIGPEPGDAFIEIGPGTGALTLALAAHPVAIVAVELDRDLLAGLRRAAPPNVRVVEGDVLRVDLEALSREVPGAPGGGETTAPSVRVVGNLPYNISSPILLRLAGLARTSTVVRDATLMLQAEVAARVVARPGGGDYGPLSIAVQLRADARLLLSLPAGAFRPAPKVRSALVSLSFRPLDVELADEAVFDAVVRAVFTQRRKTLSNALRSFAAARGLDADDVLAAVGLDGRRRPETLSRPEYARLANVLASAHPLSVL